MKAVRAAMVLLLILAAACTAPKPRASPKPSRSSSVASPAASSISRTHLTVIQAAHVIQAMTVDSKPVLLPTNVPFSWTAGVEATRDFFTVTYRSPTRIEEIDLAIQAANPPPPDNKSEQRRLTFHHDIHALYQVQFKDKATSERFLLWTEKGTMSNPMLADSGVPYFIASRGLSDKEFWAFAAGLRVGGRTGGLERADAQSLAAGVCPASSGEVAVFKIEGDTPQPRCGRVLPNQYLRVLNKTNHVVTFTFGRSTFTLQPQAGHTVGRNFGAVWAGGVHVLHTSMYDGGGPEIWLACCLR